MAKPSKKRKVTAQAKKSPAAAKRIKNVKAPAKKVATSAAKKTGATVKKPAAVTKLSASVLTAQVRPVHKARPSVSYGRGKDIAGMKCIQAVCFGAGAFARKVRSLTQI